MLVALIEISIKSEVLDFLLLNSIIFKEHYRIKTIIAIYLI